MATFTSSRRRRLACLVMVGTLLAANGLRQHVSNDRRSVNSAAQRFALNQSRVEDLCTDEVVAGACEVLGAPRTPDAKVTASQLGDVLAASEDEVATLLERARLKEGGATFSCRAFCEAAVSSIPKILSVAAPAKAGLGCIDAACDEEQVDVSVDALAEDGLETAPSPPEDPDLLELQPGNSTSHEELAPEVRDRLLFRVALNVIFGIFPAVDEVDGEEPEHSLLQHASEEQRNGAPGDPSASPAIVFGKEIQKSRHRQYREYVVKASAWIATALRRLRSGRYILQKWFVLADALQADAQERETREHLKRMLQLMSNLAIHKGPPELCPVKGTLGVAAYVNAYPDCDVQSQRDCGEKDSDGRYVLNMCDHFWGRHIGLETRVGTFVHESSHHFGTKDIGYCSMVDCLQFSSEDARRNADSYKEFVRELVTAVGVKDDEIRVMDPSCNAMCNAEHFGQWEFTEFLPYDHCGVCAEKTRVWDGCDESEVNVASGFVNDLCCKPVQCKLGSEVVRNYQYPLRPRLFPFQGRAGPWLQQREEHQQPRQRQRRRH